MKSLFPTIAVGLACLAVYASARPVLGVGPPAEPAIGASHLPEDKGERTALHKAVTLEGAFGKAEFDVRSPRMLALFLRQPDGTLSAKSLLCACASEFPAWAVGGVTYARGTNDVHYSSRHSSGHTIGSGSSPTNLTISGIRARSEDGREMPATEDWTLRVESDGSLSWKVVRKWESDFEAKFAGEPALFFNIRPNPQPTASGQNRLNPFANGVMANWWLRSEALIPEKRPEYASRTWVVFCPPQDGAVMRARDGWAILKFYTSFPNLADLRVAATGGHLYRRASFNAFCEVGLTPKPDARLRFSKGEVVATVLRLASSPQFDTGQQLMVEIPDREMQVGLKSFFGGLANCGALCDNVNHHLGNQCDGFLYAGNMWMHAYSLLASVPGAAMSPAPVGYPEAFRKNLVAILQSVHQRGEVGYGFRHPQKGFPELGAIGLLAVEADLLYMGDASVARAHRDAIRRMLDYFEPWMAGELFYVPKENLSDPKACPNWYYDNIRAGGFILYHNLLLYRALGAAETVYAALGDAGTATRLKQRRERMRFAINRVFWRDDAYGPDRGGYLDWVADKEMTDTRAQFISCGQFMAIVFGVADKRQAKAILRTADHFIAQLRRSNGYSREATLDNLVPHRREDQAGPRPFGGYMNGGMLLAMTFWEVVARCQAGDAKGAHELLLRFAARAGRTNWYEGENAFSMDAKPCGWNGEPYLADQIVAAASLVHGFLGLSYTLDDFRLDPRLPPGWDKMSAEIQFKGRRYRVTAQANGTWTKVSINPQSKETPWQPNTCPSH